MEERNIRKLLKRYLLGHAEEKDLNAVDNWYRSFDSEQIILSEEEAAATRQEIWDKIEPVTRIEPVTGIEPAPRIDAIRAEKKVRALRSWLRVAAMIILLAGAAITFLIIRNNKTSHTNLLASITITTGVGEKKNIAMEDGSLLTLDAGSTIRIQKDISQTRKIEVVDGQVFFDVKKDEQRPFIIQSEGLTTTVLGTSFNVSAYKGLHNMSIGVISGKVSVVRDETTLGVLEKDEELVYNKTDKSYKKVPLDESVTAWQEGRLLLNDLSFFEMAVVMKKNFGTEIETSDEAITHTKYTTELLISMTPVEAAQVLAAIHHLKIKEKDNKIFLTK